MNDLGKYVTEQRTAKDLSARKLAELAKVSHTEIHRIENGERKSPSPFVLKSIASALGVKFEEIMKAAGYMEEVPPVLNTSIDLSGIYYLNEKELEEVRDFIEFLRSRRETHH